MGLEASCKLPNIKRRNECKAQGEDWLGWKDKNTTVKLLKEGQNGIPGAGIAKPRSPKRL